MIKRPAFVDSLLKRYRALFGLRPQLEMRVGALALAFAATFVVAAQQLDNRRQAEMRRAAAAGFATTAAIWLDGDAHAGLGETPERRLSDLGALLGKALESNGFEGTVRTLKPTAEARTKVLATPGSAHPGALQTVLSRGGEKQEGPGDYRPEMAATLVEGQPVALIEGDRVRAYAPVVDSWGATVAMVAVEGTSRAPLWRRVVFLIASGLVAGLFMFGGLWMARGFGRRLASSLELLTACARDLSQGRVGTPIGVEGTLCEVVALAEALESLRGTLAGGTPARPQPAPVAAPVVGPARAPARPRLGTEEPTEFDLALLVQQLIEPVKHAAHGKGVETQVIFPEGVPTRLVGAAGTLHRTLEVLLDNAVRSVEQGRITLRVTRAGVDANGVVLRFEISDTGPGIAFNEQQELQARLAEAAEADPARVQDPLVRAGALAALLGGELGFQTQPGQGSRFGFAAAFQLLGPLPATAFQPRPALAGTSGPSGRR